MEVSAWSSAANGFPDGLFNVLILAALSVATVILRRWDFFGSAWRFFVLFNVRLQHFSCLFLGRPMKASQRSCTSPVWEVTGSLSKLAATKID